MKIWGLMTCSGFAGGCSTEWIMAWVGLFVIAVLILAGKKFLSEDEVLGVGFNWVYSIAGAILYIIMISFTGSPKWSLLIGLIVTLGAGYVSGYFGGSE